MSAVERHLILIYFITSRAMRAAVEQNTAWRERVSSAFRFQSTSQVREHEKLLSILSKAVVAPAGLGRRTLGGVGRTSCLLDGGDDFGVTCLLGGMGDPPVGCIGGGAASLGGEAAAVNGTATCVDVAAKIRLISTQILLHKVQISL